MTTMVTTTSSTGVAVTPPSGQYVFPMAVTVVAESTAATVELRDTTDGSGPPYVVVKAAAGTSNRWVTADVAEQGGMSRVYVTIAGSGDPRALLEYAQHA
jgi:hypothetical protein